ncbi:MAG: hypothetical protein ACPG45_05375 [Flavobacteriaceae bacterium]
MKTLFSLLLIVATSCSKNITQDDLQHLNGYWDIEFVESEAKKITKFGVNSTIDFYYLNDNNKGYRKKVKPDFSGKYKTNNIKDSIRITNENNQFIIHTSTPLDSWEDIIIELTPEKLILQNDKGVLFHYKKHEKYNF